MAIFRKRLEEHFKGLLGVKHIVLTGMGRSAITVGLRALDVSEGDEVVVPAFICPAVERAVRMSGATPIYADIDRDSFNLTVKTVEKVLSKRCKAILISHTYGFPADAKGFRDLCDKKGLMLIEDCVSSFERYCSDKEARFFGDIAIFSVYKLVVNTGGGFIVADNEDLAYSCRRELKKLKDETARAKIFQKFYSAAHNLFSSIYEIYGIRPPFYSLIAKYLKDFHREQTNVEGSGGDKRIIITNIECLLACLQLSLLRGQISRRLKGSNMLFEKFEGFRSVLPRNDKVIYGYRIFPIVIEDGQRDEFVEAANSAGLNVMIPWHPLDATDGATFIKANTALFPVGTYNVNRINELQRILERFEKLR